MRCARRCFRPACVRGHAEVVALLLDHGADVRVRDKEGRTPLLFWAAEKKEQQLQTAANGNLALVDELDAGASVNAALFNGMTPAALGRLHFNGHEPVVRLLLARDETSLDAKDGFDRTPMLCARPSASTANNNRPKVAHPD